MNSTDNIPSPAHPTDSGTGRKLPDMTGAPMPAPPSRHRRATLFIGLGILAVLAIGAAMTAPYLLTNSIGRRNQNPKAGHIRQCLRHPLEIFRPRLRRTCHKSVLTARQEPGRTLWSLRYSRRHITRKSSPHSGKRLTDTADTHHQRSARISPVRRPHSCKIRLLRR